MRLLSTGRERLFVAHCRPPVFYSDREQASLGIRRQCPGPTTTSLSAPARQAARSPTGWRKIIALRILILEAGPADDSFLLKMPAGFASLGETSRHTTGATKRRPKRSATTAACTGRAERRWAVRRRSTPCSMSAATLGTTTIGASSATTAGAYDDVLPFFKKAENNERGDDDYHGAGGPLNVADQGDPLLKINDAFLAACRAGRAQEAWPTSTAPPRKASATTR